MLIKLLAILELVVDRKALLQLVGIAFFELLISEAAFLKRAFGWELGLLVSFALSILRPIFLLFCYNGGLLVIVVVSGRFIEAHFILEVIEDLFEELASGLGKVVIEVHNFSQ